MKKGHYKLNLIQIKHLLKQLNKEHFVESILETYSSVNEKWYRTS